MRKVVYSKVDCATLYIPDPVIPESPYIPPRPVPKPEFNNQSESAVTSEESTATRRPEIETNQLEVHDSEVETNQLEVHGDHEPDDHLQDRVLQEHALAVQREQEAEYSDIYGEESDLEQFTYSDDDFLYPDEVDKLLRKKEQEYLSSTEKASPLVNDSSLDLPNTTVDPKAVALLAALAGLSNITAGANDQVATNNLDTATDPPVSAPTSPPLPPVESTAPTSPPVAPSTSAPASAPPPSVKPTTPTPPPSPPVTEAMGSGNSTEKISGNDESNRSFNLLGLDIHFPTMVWVFMSFFLLFIALSCMLRLYCRFSGAYRRSQRDREAAAYMRNLNQRAQQGQLIELQRRIPETQNSMTVPLMTNQESPIVRPIEMA